MKKAHTILKYLTKKLERQKQTGNSCTSKFRFKKVCCKEKNIQFKLHMQIYFTTSVSSQT